jgi:hypothetical protein
MRTSPKSSSAVTMVSLGVKASRAHSERLQVAKPSKSQVQAAISAIIEREQREGVASPILHINESNRAWIRRNLRKHLDPVFSEMGLNKDKLEQVVTRHQDEVRHYLKKQESKTAKRL